MDLLKKRCKPCEGIGDRLSPQQQQLLQPSIAEWKLDGLFLTRTIQLDDFKQAMAFLNRVAEVAEAEGHHPDFSVSWNKIDFRLQTHAVKGLTENDFILAAKISALSLS